MTALKIFVVDDDKNYAKGLGLLLKVKGHEVTLAYSGEEAVRVCAEQQFDLVLMDVRMPGMSGVESFFQLRKLNPNAKVMMMTAYSVEQLLDQAIEGGALGVLYKPVKADKLFATLEKVKPAGIVLVVDDDPGFTKAIKLLLLNNGYRVYIAHNGQDAVNKVLDNGIDILVLDLHLPVLSGLEVYLELKKQGRLLPTIIVTGYATEEAETIKQLKDLSISGCLVKPFDINILLGAINTVLEQDSHE